MSETILRNAKIVLADDVVAGTVQVSDGAITDISTGSSQVGEDMCGDFLIPGLIELHTDHLETHYRPRPTVCWNPAVAVLAHDAQIAAAGITTVFDAMPVGRDGKDALTSAECRMLADAIDDAKRHNRLRAEHFLHLRCEVSAPDCMETFSLFDADESVRLISLMDHAPGQRQFTSFESYKTYYLAKSGVSEDVFDTYCKNRIEQSNQYAPPNRQHISEVSRNRGISLASHDDATVEHVAESKLHGISIAEFPTTVAAAEASRAAGIQVLMGAPNVVRGGSHSGNVSAAELINLGHLDILSSDYIPFSLLQAVFMIGSSNWLANLPHAIRLVTKHPAEAANLRDRGEIAAGKRADIVRVRLSSDVPVVSAVWREGSRVL